MPSGVPIANGGTGATTAANARSNLGANNAGNLTTGTLPAAVQDPVRPDKRYGRILDNGQSDSRVYCYAYYCLLLCREPVLQRYRGTENRQ